MQSLNPLDWQGPEFLALYAALAVLALCAAWLLRANMPATVPPGQAAGLGPVELGYLSGGRERAADTVAVGFLAAGAATLDVAGGCFSVEPDPPRLPRELEPYRGVASGIVSRRNFIRALQPRLDAMQAALERRGLVPDAAQLARLCTWTVLLFGALIAFGFMKLAVGASRGRPVGFLVGMMLASALALVALLNRPPRRTRAGQAALGEYAARHSRAARAPLGPEMALAFALTGPAVLAGTELDAYRKIIAPPGSGSDGGGSGCGGGGDSGGSGCGGCGS